MGVRVRVRIRVRVRRGDVRVGLGARQERGVRALDARAFGGARTR